LLQSDQMLLGMPDSPAGGSAEAADVSGDAGNIRAAIKEIIASASNKVDLTEANIIISQVVVP
jgi:electron transfer flavoprotein alpha subunit